MPKNIDIIAINSIYFIDTSIPCNHDRENINVCGQRREGARYPYCALENIGHCPQVLVTRFLTPVNEETISKTITK